MFPVGPCLPLLLHPNRGLELRLLSRSLSSSPPRPSFILVPHLGVRVIADARSVRPSRSSISNSQTLSVCGPLSPADVQLRLNMSPIHLRAQLRTLGYRLSRGEWEPGKGRSGCDIFGPSGILIVDYDEKDTVESIQFCYPANVSLLIDSINNQRDYVQDLLCVPVHALISALRTKLPLGSVCLSLPPLQPDDLVLQPLGEMSVSPWGFFGWGEGRDDDEVDEEDQEQDKYGVMRSINGVRRCFETVGINNVEARTFRHSNDLLPHNQ